LDYPPDLARPAGGMKLSVTVFFVFWRGGCFSLWGFIFLPFCHLTRRFLCSSEDDPPPGFFFFFVLSSTYGAVSAASGAAASFFVRVYGFVFSVGSVCVCAFSFRFRVRQSLLVFTP